MFRADPFSVRNREPVLELPVPSELASVPRRSQHLPSVVEGQTSDKTIQDVENRLIGLGLLDPHPRLNQPSPPPETVNENGLATSSSNIATRQSRPSSPSTQIQLRQASGEDRTDAKPKSSIGQKTGKKIINALPTSPSVSKFKTRKHNIRVLPLVQLAPFASGFFLDDDVEAKRTLGLSNIFRGKLASKTSGKGEKAIRKPCQANKFLGNIVVNDEEKTRKGSAERDWQFEV